MFPHSRWLPEARTVSFTFRSHDTGAFADPVTGLYSELSGVRRRERGSRDAKTGKSLKAELAYKSQRPLSYRFFWCAKKICSSKGKTSGGKRKTLANWFRLFDVNKMGVAPLKVITRLLFWFRIYDMKSRKLLVPALSAFIQTNDLAWSAAESYILRSGSFVLTAAGLPLLTLLFSK